ncbi:MAG: PEGA domain-containing protein [bacterium]
MKRCLSFLLLFLIVTSVVSQDNKKDQKNKPTPAEATPPATVRPPLAFGLVEDTPVRLKLSRTMSSKDATLNEKVDFEVLEDVKVGDVVVIQHGGMAIATVTEAQHKRRMGRAGKLNMNIDYVQLVSGEKVPLRAVRGGSGGSHTGVMTGAIVATSILFFPAAPFFLFMHGKDITIPRGTEITAYVAADTPLEPADFKALGTADQPSNPISAEVTTVTINSTPAGADVLIDGKFVGNTPSSLPITPGEHTIAIERTGFKTWQRTVTVVARGSANIDATLEKIP